MKDFLKLMFNMFRVMFYLLLIFMGVMGFITTFRSVDDSSCVLATTCIVSLISIMYSVKNLIRILKETNYGN